MAIYLKEFSTHSEYEQYINGSGAILPNVSICIQENDVHYNPSTPPTPVETRLVAKFNVDDTSNPTQIGYDDYISGFSEIEIDGVAQPSVVSAYTFSTEGEHTVKYTLADPTSIGNSAFSGCSNLTSIDIPNGVTSIGDNAFDDCYYLTSITIPDNVTSIGYEAFESSNLTSVIIGSGVTSIGEYAFWNCTYLESVTIMATTPPSIGNSIFGGEMSIPTIYVPSASVEAYKSASGWSDYDSYIEPIS